ncbi:hypothetical protein [Actinoallomurus iriomotensis]|uniref:Uncharacterized protein n=1 Tax=Actinoallomurus iriomotensis TaxID=478107 RepID=A0A9W6S9P5_9ACTN|nr:hypothetical protein [Actinoallomurus iriomotensis]GLY89638.1 hypothetical protein Airi02_075670 [Actinoallomurus iriomotensis]
MGAAAIDPEPLAGDQGFELSMTGPAGDAAAKLKPAAATTNGAVTTAVADWRSQY